MADTDPGPYCIDRDARGYKQSGPWRINDRHFAIAEVDSVLHPYWADDPTIAWTKGPAGPTGLRQGGRVVECSAHPYGDQLMVFHPVVDDRYPYGAAWQSLIFDTVSLSWGERLGVWPMGAPGAFGRIRDYDGGWWAHSYDGQNYWDSSDGLVWNSLQPFTQWGYQCWGVEGALGRMHMFGGRSGDGLYHRSYWPNGTWDDVFFVCGSWALWPCARPVAWKRWIGESEDAQGNPIAGHYDYFIGCAFLDNRWGLGFPYGYGYGYPKGFDYDLGYPYGAGYPYDYGYGGYGGPSWGCGLSFAFAYDDGVGPLQWQIRTLSDDFLDPYGNGCAHFGVDTISGSGLHCQWQRHRDGKMMHGWSPDWGLTWQNEEWRGGFNFGFRGDGGLDHSSCYQRGQDIYWGWNWWDPYDQSCGFRYDERRCNRSPWVDADVPKLHGRGTMM
jgi:hypothetical protein